MSAKSPTRKQGFALKAPEAQNVALAGSFTNWEQNPIPLKRQKNGVWKASLALDPGQHEYRYLVDGQWTDDPDCAQRAPNPFGGENCIRTVA
jgi:1,4-alpha-glucan branching enzyme